MGSMIIYFNNNISEHDKKMFLVPPMIQLDLHTIFQLKSESDLCIMVINIVLKVGKKIGLTKLKLLEGNQNGKVSNIELKFENIWSLHTKIIV